MATLLQTPQQPHTPVGTPPAPSTPQLDESCDSSFLLSLRPDIRTREGPSSLATSSSNTSTSILSPQVKGTPRAKLQPLKTAAAKPSLQSDPFIAVVPTQQGSSALSSLQAAASHPLASSSGPQGQTNETSLPSASIPPSESQPFTYRLSSSPALKRAATVSAPSRPQPPFGLSSSDHERTRTQSTAVGDLSRRKTTNAPRYTSFEPFEHNATPRTVTGVPPASFSPPHSIGPSPRIQRRRSSAAALSAGPTVTAPALQSSQSHRIARSVGGLEAKVVILGAQGVGKTSIVHRYTSGQFSASAVPSTIGASFLTKKLVVEDCKCRLQIWDTAGQERFRSMAPMYYRGSHAAIIVYDITSRESFEDVKTWLDELKQNMSEELIIHVIGAKSDLAPFAREVDSEFAREQVLRWLCPERESAIRELAASSQVSAQGQSRPVATTSTSSSRLQSLGSLAMGSASRHLGVAFPVKKLVGSGGAGNGASHQQSGAVVSPGSASDSDGSGGAGMSVADVTVALPGDELDVQLTEVSAKDDDGSIEDVFVAITERLVERRAELEQKRLERERHSIFLTDDQDLDGDNNADAARNWSCC